jgi:GcrA cell cycle regulator
MEWSDGLIAKLRALWATDLSTAQIGLRMDISKNAVVGKAHRLDLPPRPSPIRRDGVSKPRKPKSVRAAVTLPPLRSVEPAVPTSTQSRLAQPVTSVRSPTAQAPLPSYGPDIRRLRGHRAASSSPQLFPPTRVVTPPVLADKCVWPLWGHQERPTHRYCERPSEGRWCEEHCRLGYERRHDSGRTTRHDRGPRCCS